MVEPARDAEDSIDALETSARLVALIDEELDRAGGWIPFSRFMDLALHAPGLGYYSAGSAKVGRGPADGSDFVTAPELTPLFARALAAPAAEVLAAGGATILELGGGSGRLAADLLTALEERGALPSSYLLLEPSADFRQRQHATLAVAVPHLVGRVRWLDVLPERIDGFVFGNEVLDALPVELVEWMDEAWLRRGVARGDDGFVFADRPASEAIVAAARASIPAIDRLPDRYVTELHPAARGLVATLVERMTATAAMLWTDYGFPASEYFHPQRTSGTLMAHRRHRSRVDVLSCVGLQDLTAHVDFSAIAAAAEAAGASTIGYTNQANFLIDCGIAEMLQGGADDTRRWAPQAAALQILLSEAEMGELFKAIAFARTPRTLRGFGRSDRRATL